MHRFRHALTRRPGPALADGLTTSDLGAPDFALAGRQFEAYVAALEKLGLKVTVLDPLPGFPDAHFVEDAAVMTPNGAVIARSGAPERDGEQESVAAVLAPRMELTPIAPPGTLDGGDVLRVGSHFLIGLSERTNAEGARQLGRTVEARSGTWSTVPVARGLHFKSEVNVIGEKTLLLTAAYEDQPELAGFERLVVPDGDEYAANSLRINDTLLIPAGYPATRDLLAERGFETVELDTGEFRKMDGGLTCLSLRW